MDEVGLIEAWRRWAQGDLDVKAVQLWGMSILWWGRIGKLTALAAALTIIAEIVGPKRLRAFGDSMHRMIEPNRCLGFVVDVLKWTKAWFVYGWSQDEGRKLDAEIEMDDSPVNMVCTVPIWLVLIGAWIGAIIAVSREYGFGLALTLGVVVGFVFASFVTLLTIPVMAVSLSGVGLLLAAIDAVLIERIARLLEHKHLDKLIKLGSAVLLILGFHFDLLAS